MSENTNTLFWVITGAVIVIALFTLINSSSNNTTNKIFNEFNEKYNLVINSQKELTEEEKLEILMIDLGKNYYISFLYPQYAQSFSHENLVNFLSGFSSTGLKVSIDNLVNYSLIGEEIINFTNAQCDTANTKAIIYPDNPFEVNDFHIEAVLDCIFNN